MMIQYYGIKIIEIQKFPENFYNRGVSALCFKMKPTFIFNCEKNKYTFDIYFIDDCDCYPCILEVKNLTDKKTNTKIEINCDLYSGTRNGTTTKCLLKFLNYDTILDYQSSEFRIFYELPKVLSDNAVEIISCENNIQNSITINDQEFNYYLQIKTQKGVCTIVPHDYESEFQLYTLPSLEFMNKDRTYKYDKLEYNSFHSQPKYTWRFNYKSHSDITDLIKYINEYFDYLNGEYGYYCMMTKTFKNENQAMKLLKEYHLNLHNELKNFNSDEFNIDFVISDKTNPEFGVCIVIDSKYPVGIYKVIFRYNKKRTIMSY